MIFNCLKIVPFVIDSIHKGESPDTVRDPYQHKVSDGAAVSKDTGILLALFAVGLLVGSPILGYLSNKKEQKKV